MYSIALKTRASFVASFRDGTRDSKCSLIIQRNSIKLYRLYAIADIISMQKGIERPHIIRNSVSYAIR